MSIDHLPATGRADVPEPGRFRHEALLYRGHEQFVERTAAFVRDALRAEESVMVAVIEPRASLLREELGSDARHVRFIDMAVIGRNPARIIPAWREWVEESGKTGRGFRGIGEPIWPGRSPAQLVECQQHEALLNTAFDEGPSWWLLCPYDTSSLDADVLTTARRTHPALMDAGRSLASDRYPDSQFSRSAMFSAPLPEPAAPLFQTGFGLSDLPRIRQVVANLAGSQRVSPGRVDDLVLVANELACNSIKHGGGSGMLRMWLEGCELVCEVRDRGVITDPLVGRRRPDPQRGGGAGLWIANLLCDLVQIRSTPQNGTTVRVYVETASDGPSSIAGPGNENPGNENPGNQNSGNQNSGNQNSGNHDPMA